MIKNILKLPIFVGLLVLIITGGVKISGAGNSHSTVLDTQSDSVRIQKEKGPAGHSTIGIVESAIEQDTTKTLRLSFSKLMSWEYEAQKDTPAPDMIAKLDGRKVKITGFMYPLQQGTKIQYFCLLRTTQTCCYGPRPQYNQYIFVEMGAPTPFFRLDPVACAGTFNVEPNPDEGYIYRLEGETCNAVSEKDSLD